jgi:hypothetical protein
MTNPTDTVNSLLRNAAAKSGTSPEEAHTAATFALKLAKKHGLGGHTIARCLNVLSRAEARRSRAA